MRKQQSVCKIYYFPSLDGGGFEEVPTAEYQQPEKSIEEKLMDIIGWQLLWLVPALMTVILAYHFNLWVIPAALSAAGLGWYCRQRGWW